MSEQGKREKLYILGHPIGHSKSPVMYNAVYEKLGLNWHYDFMDCESEQQARAFLEACDFLSINITTPYKPQAFEAATVRAASAKLAHGANVLVRKKDALIAYNVDGQGCVRYLERTGTNFANAQVVVCGTGPTALAILHAVALAGAAQVVLVGRDKDRSQAMLTRYVSDCKTLLSTAIDLPATDGSRLSMREAYETVQMKFGSYATSKNAIAQADVIIDATSLGMKPHDPAPFDVDLISSRQTVFDVVYGHGQTALLAGARAKGAMAHDGAGMLVAQAVVTAGIVFDIAEVPEEVATALSFDELFDIMAHAAGFEV